MRIARCKEVFLDMECKTLADRFRMVVFPGGLVAFSSSFSHLLKTSEVSRVFAGKVDALLIIIDAVLMLASRF